MQSSRRMHVWDIYQPLRRRCRFELRLQAPAVSISCVPLRASWSNQKIGFSLLVSMEFITAASQALHRRMSVFQTKGQNGVLGMNVDEGSDDYGFEACCSCWCHTGKKTSRDLQRRRVLTRRCNPPWLGTLQLLVSPLCADWVSAGNLSCDCGGWHQNCASLSEN